MAIDLDKNHPARGKMPVRKIASRLVPLVLQGVGHTYLIYLGGSHSNTSGGALGDLLVDLVFLDCAFFFLAAGSTCSQPFCHIRSRMASLL